MATLFLTIKRQWFDKILSGEKTIEYRDATKKFYEKRFQKTYSKILLQAGYNPTSPRLEADIVKIELINGQYEIHLTNPIKVR